MEPEGSLYFLAVKILTTHDALEKASITLDICKAWNAGLIPIGSGGGDLRESLALSPSRPLGVVQVHPTKVKSSSKKHMLHALCHAESYAIDLSWDVIARYGWSPETWQPAPPFTVRDKSDNDDDDDIDASHHRLPAAFFRDWVKVAGEEATHFLRWHNRLVELGAKYGDFPAHGSLWESAEKTSHSLAARLAVVHCVHEGRGLDVAATLFAKLGAGGDLISQEILSKNLAEEVTHVAAGVRWLKYLCDCGSVEIIPAFHDLVRRHFHGVLRPPFADTERGIAGMTPEWYLPLCALGKSGEEEGGSIELTAEDMG
jgi:uncharacterized ferritin-like protein (DUF455 family)